MRQNVKYYFFSCTKKITFPDQSHSLNLIGRINLNQYAYKPKSHTTDFIDYSRSDDFFAEIFCYMIREYLSLRLTHIVDIPLPINAVNLHRK